MSEPGRLYGDTRCPNCGIQNDGYTTLKGPATPKDGDVSICIYCGTVNAFTVNAVTGAVRIRRPTPAELREYMQDPTVRKALMAVSRFIASRRPSGGSRGDERG